MYELYGDKGSGSAAIELALALIGAEVELRDVPLESDAQRAAAYAALNPQRKLPALLIADGQLVTESAAILLVLADRHPAAHLLPEEPAARADGLRWLVFMAAELYPIVEIIDYPQRFHPHGNKLSDADCDAMRVNARAIWKRRWLIVEQAATGQNWFLPSGFSVLDIYAAVLSRWGQIGKWRRHHLVKIERIASQVSQRPGLEAIWERHFG